MENLFLLFETDEWNTTSNKNLAFVGTSLEMCQAYIKKRYESRIDSETLSAMCKQLEGYYQTQCNNVGFEFMIELWKPNDMER